jgi:hypothetical protein
MDPLKNAKQHSLEGEHDEKDNFANARFLEPGRTHWESGGRTIFHCDDEDGAFTILEEQFNCAKYRGMAIGLIIADCANYDEMVSANSPSQVNITLQQLGEIFAQAVLAEDVIVAAPKGRFYVLTYGADQFAAANLCQILKEGMRRFTFFKCGLNPKPHYDFAVADDRVCETLPALFEHASRALKFAEKLGEGAVVRSSDLHHTWGKRPREHFGLGEIWLKDKLQH